MEEAKWNFPHNNYSDENGLDTSDMETFRKDPMSSLAREICQNSIDASSGNGPVRVEFAVFTLTRDEIPGIDRLSQEIERCYQYKKDSPKEGKALAGLRRRINSPTITCMRISDFNTTGVNGVSSNERGKPFYNLTRGAGVSDKLSSSGGSKGIGKYASFVVSGTNTVFYSTQTDGGERGYLGISRLRSVPFENDPALMTLGTGYYGIGEKNLPIQEELHLDSSFARADGETGTDVFLIGFNSEGDWKDEIVTKVLESFMVAIMRKKLEVVVDGMLVNDETVGGIISSGDFGSCTKADIVKAVRSQYELLKEFSYVTKEEVPLADGNSVTIYMRQYSQQDAAQATKRCYMVRYPYMKITHITTGAMLPFSALCIIEKGDLNDDLRSIENPQHIGWEPKRLEEFPEDKRRVVKRLNTLKEGVKAYILDSLRKSSGDSTDIYGAGDFLPSQNDFGESTGSGAQEQASNEGQGEQPAVTPIVVTKAKVPKTVKSGSAGESLEFSTGSETENGEEGALPHDTKTPPNPNPYPDPEPNPPDYVNPNEGDKPILKKVPLSGMRYRNIVRDKHDGQYACVFTSLYDEKNCDFQIRMCGEGTDKFPIPILEAAVNGKSCTVENGCVTGLSLAKGMQYAIVYKVGSHELFASEVILNAYR